MGDLSADALQRFFVAVGTRLAEPSEMHVLGGGALILLGSPRDTGDLDFVGSDLATGQHRLLRAVLDQVAKEMSVDVDPIPFDEYIPLPAGVQTRHRLVGQFGKLTVYVFDPYSIALSKMERGFKTDIEDVVFLLREKIIVLEKLKEIAKISVATRTRV